MQKLDIIRIASLPVECIVGILPEERTLPQALIVTIDLHLDVSVAAESGQLSETIDYAATAREVTFILTAAQFPLLETAALALCRYLATSPVEMAQVTLTKPLALNRVGVPSVTVVRGPRLDFTGRGPVFAGADAGIYRLKAASEPVAMVYPWQSHADLALRDGSVLRVYRRGAV